MRSRLIVGLVGVVGFVAQGCGGGDDIAATNGTVPVTVGTTAAPVVTTMTTAAPETTTTTVVTRPPVPVATPDGCAPDTSGELLETTRSPASPYFVHHPAQAGPSTATVMFLPGGSTGSRRGAQRVWGNYLSNGDGVDEFRLVMPFSKDYDLIDDRERMLAIVDEVLACFGGDPAKFHVAGRSQGGQIAFTMMLRWPEYFATLLGAPGEFRVVDPDAWRVALAGKAVFNGVGGEDIDWIPSVKAVHDGLVEAGIESVYVEFPGEGHGVSPEFDESIFYDFWRNH